MIPRSGPGVLTLALACAALLAAAACRADSHESADGAGDASPTGGSVIEAIDAFIEKEDIDKSKSGWKTRLPRPPVQEFDGDKTYLWNLETSEGDIVIRLMPDVAPMHVTSTLYLTRLGFYDDTVFHRVIPGFMAQGGDPLGNGTGGPGYSYDGEIDPASNKHDRPGLLSMANRGPGTDGSQFFITFVPTPWLDEGHTIFGEVVEGQETLPKLEQHGSRPHGRTSKKLELRKASVRVE